MAAVLIAIAERRVGEVWHDWLFTQAIRRGFDVYERGELIGNLWRVALADGVLHRLESFLVERVAAELEVPEDDLATMRAQIAAMRRASEEEEQ